MIGPNLRRALLTTIATLFLSVALLAAQSSAHAQALDEYDDKVYLKNGDRITGNIKELDRGKLRVKTTTMDTIYLNWVEVESVESNTYPLVPHAMPPRGRGKYPRPPVAGT